MWGTYAIVVALFAAFTAILAYPGSPAVRLPNTISEGLQCLNVVRGKALDALGATLLIFTVIQSLYWIATSAASRFGRWSGLRISCLSQMQSSHIFKKVIIGYVHSGFRPH